MLRFTKGCKDTNVAGRYFLLPRHLLELRFLAKLQKIPRKAAISHLHVWVCVRCREDLFYRLFASFQGRSRQSALDVTMAELAIESFFPADEATASLLRAAWNSGGQSARH